MVSKVQKEKIAMALMDAHNDNEFPADIAGIIDLINKATISDKTQARVAEQLKRAKASVAKLEKLAKKN